MYLLIGSDARTDVPDGERKRFGTTEEVPGERADIVVVLNARPDGTVRTLSIPRDLTVFRRGGGPERLAPLLQDGPGAIADALCNSLGIGVDHVAVVRFSGLVDLVDLAGGVTIRPSATMLDRNSGLLVRGGAQRVDGRTALAYVRARTVERREGDRWVPDPVESERRSDRALEVLRGLGSSTRPSWNPWHDHRLAWAVTGAVTVDGGTGIGELMALGDATRSIGGDALETLPVLTRHGSVPAASVTPDAEAAVDEFTGGVVPTACSVPTLLGG